jgi:hypothetical protein
LGFFSADHFHGILPKTKAGGGFSSGIYYAILGIVVFRIIRTGQTTSLKMESDVIS